MDMVWVCTLFRDGTFRREQYMRDTAVFILAELRHIYGTRIWMEDVENPNRRIM